MMNIGVTYDLCLQTHFPGIPHATMSERAFRGTEQVLALHAAAEERFRTWAESTIGRILSVSGPDILPLKDCVAVSFGPS